MKQVTTHFRILRLFAIVISILPDFILQFMWDSISIYSQKPFLAARYILIYALSRNCGDNVYIGKNVTIKNWRKISIGANVSIHDNCYIDAYGDVTIGDNVSIAHNSSIVSSNHTYNDVHIPIKYNPVEPGSVNIDCDVWIGCGTKILADVIIGKRCIIAAGCVVTSSCESNSIYAGIPNKKVKSINSMSPIV